MTGWFYDSENHRVRWGRYWSLAVAVTFVIVAVAALLLEWWWPRDISLEALRQVLSILLVLVLAFAALAAMEYSQLMSQLTWWADCEGEYVLTLDRGLSEEDLDKLAEVLPETFPLEVASSLSVLSFPGLADMYAQIVCTLEGRLGYTVTHSQFI